jgi:hypothetical protein
MYELYIALMKDETLEEGAWEVFEGAERVKPARSRSQSGPTALPSEDPTIIEDAIEAPELGKAEDDDEEEEEEEEE